MNSDISTKRSLRYGISAIWALALSIALGAWNVSIVRAQSDGGTAEAAGPSAETAPDQNAATDADQSDPNAAAVQQAHDAVDAAEEALDTATEARDQLESDGASQDQIDAASQAIAQARANKDAAEAAAQNADNAPGQ
jgi:hypothetical protein